MPLGRLFGRPPAQSVRTNKEAARAARPLRQHMVSGFDRSLFLLLCNGGISVAWGAALAVFATGVVPITWNFSQYGQRHTGLTNVIVTGVATMATMHLKYTASRAAEVYTTMRLAEGLVLPTWGWLQAVAATSIWPPFPRGEHWLAWLGWLLLFGGMAGHSASIVAILQPQLWFDHRPFNDPTPCGVDPASLTLLNSRLTAQPLMDQDAFMVGLQFGNYFGQVAKNTTSAVDGRNYVKDNFGYGAFGGLSDALQDVPGVEISSQCKSSHDATSLSSLWSSSFPGSPLVTSSSNDTDGFFTSIVPNGSQAVIQSSFNSTSMPFNSPSIPVSSRSMSAAVNASGSGAMVITEDSGLTTSCTWVAIPRLLLVEIRNFTALTASAESAPIVPAPVGRAVYATFLGIAQAVRFGATLDATSDGYPRAADILQTLIADGLKAALTAQYTEDCWQHGPDVQACLAVGISICNSHSRTVQQHWRFGDDHFLGILAIALTLVFGLYALWVVWTDGAGHL
ncbi:hypothetical protein FB451DRAFT_1557478 [Mycena latifolia]|nr:hypothetical protein FB451DRAFT_1557478 [Mycena latifolia]